VGDVLLAGEEAQERTALFRDVIAERSGQHGSALERVEDRAVALPGPRFEFHLGTDFANYPQVSGASHGSCQRLDLD